MKIRKLLSIDDDEINNYIIKLVLEDSQLIEHIVFSTNGSHALQYLDTCDAEQTFPELILVDLNMPVMDGLQFIMLYEEQFYHKYPNTQLHVLTSSMREAEKQHALNFAPVKSYNNKPLDQQKLISMVKTYYQHTNGSINY